MKLIKKIMCWNSDLSISENVLLVCYRVFTYLFPAGLMLWCLVIDKLLDNEVSMVAKVGCGGLFLICALLIVAVVMLGRHFKNTIEDLNDKLIDCVDIEKKKELVEKKKQVRKWQEVYRNACIVAPFIVILLVVNLLENGIVTFRGMLTAVVLSMCVGFGFNITAQNLISKNK